MIKKLPHWYVRQFLLAWILRPDAVGLIRIDVPYHLQMNREINAVMLAKARLNVTEWIYRDTSVIQNWHSDKLSCDGIYVSEDSVIQKWH